MWGARSMNSLFGRLKSTYPDYDSVLHAPTSEIEDKIHYHNIMTSHLIEIRNYYFKKNRQTFFTVGGQLIIYIFILQSSKRSESHPLRRFP
jgi:hypothetical protein